jgi:hypothetical protein
MKRRIRRMSLLLTMVTLVAASPAHVLKSALSVSARLPADLERGSSTAAQESFDPASYYRLTTQWQGDGKSLDVVNDGKNNWLVLARTDNVSGQFWKITSAGGGYYRLTTQWQGKGKSLDIVNDGKNNQPILALTANVSGQLWKITPQGNGYYRLTTQWQGDGKSLDVVNDGKNDQLVLAKTDNVSGQAWKITKIE